MKPERNTEACRWRSLLKDLFLLTEMEFSALSTTGTGLAGTEARVEKMVGEYLKMNGGELCPHWCSLAALVTMMSQSLQAQLYAQAEALALREGGGDPPPAKPPA